MKTWRIHLVWSLITVVSSAAWAQRAVRTREIEFREREKLLEVKVLEAKKTPALVAAMMAPPPPAPVPIAPIPIPERAAPEYEVQEETGRPTVEAIRKLLQGDLNDNWGAYSVISKMVKCPLKSELVQTLFRHRDAQIRRATAHLLQETLGADAAAPLFQEALRSDPDADVREAVASMLGDHEAPGNLEALLQAFQKDELRIQVICAAAMNDLGHAGPAAQMVSRIAARLDSPDGAVRREAAELLYRLRSPQALPALTRALGDSNGDVRLEAVNALYDLQDPQTLSLLEPLLNDPVAAVRNVVKGLVEELKSRKQ